jgi:hypothetical protein
MNNYAPLLQMTSAEYEATKHTLSSTTLVEITDSTVTPIAIGQNLLLSSTGGGGANPDATFLTSTDESADLPNSVPIDNIALGTTESFILVNQSDTPADPFKFTANTNGYKFETPSDVEMKMSVVDSGILINHITDPLIESSFTKANTALQHGVSYLYLSNTNGIWMSGDNGTYSFKAVAAPTETYIQADTRIVKVTATATQIIGLGTGTGTALVIDGSDNVLKDSSSARYKKDIRDLEIDTSKIFELRPVNFTFKDTNKPSFGLIAEETQEILPELVEFNSDGLVESVHYDRLTILLLAELKKLKEKVEHLEASNK